MRPVLAIVASVVFLGLGSAGSAAAAPILIVNASGILTGATGVDVDGTLYDVTFVDSSCFAVYDGCDSADDFVFSTAAAAVRASQALFDQVFTGQFDDDPQLTFGCSGNGPDCQAFTPYAVANSLADLIRAINSDNTSIDVAVGDSQAFYTSSLADCENCVYADWVQTTATPTPVPEPSTLLLLGSGVAGIVVAVRRRQSSSKLPRC